MLKEFLPKFLNRDKSPNNVSSDVPENDFQPNLNLLDPVANPDIKKVTFYEKNISYLKIPIIVLPIICLLLAGFVELEKYQVSKLRNEKTRLEEELIVYGNVGEELLEVNQKINILKNTKDYFNFENSLRKIISLVPNTMYLSTIDLRGKTAIITAGSQSPLDFSTLTSRYFTENLVNEIVLKSADYDSDNNLFEMGFDLMLK